MKKGRVTWVRENEILRNERHSAVRPPDGGKEAISNQRAASSRDHVLCRFGQTRHLNVPRGQFQRLAVSFCTRRRHPSGPGYGLFWRPISSPPAQPAWGCHQRQANGQFTPTRVFPPPAAICIPASTASATKSLFVPDDLLHQTPGSEVGSALGVSVLRGVSYEYQLRGDSLLRDSNPQSTTQKPEKRCKLREIAFHFSTTCRQPLWSGDFACQLDRSST